MDERDELYANIARTLADALMHYARDRDADSQRTIAEIQRDLCQLRRKELEATPVEPADG